MQKKILLISLFSISVLLRLSRILPNLEFVTTTLVIASLYLTKKQTLCLILAIMVFSDLILGNTSIFLFTWSGFLIPGLFLGLLSKLDQLGQLKHLSLGILSNLFFYLWTNFGVWLLDSWDMYPNSFSGLVNCYVAALPFLKTQLEGTLILLPISLVFFQLIFRLAVFKEYRCNSGTVPQL